MSDITIVSPSKRIWKRFKSHRRAYFSLVVFGFLFFFSLFAELLSNDKPMVFSYDSKIFLPLIIEYPETDFGGGFSNTGGLFGSFYQGIVRG
jgi:microcin C transport system permease protein